MRNLEPRLFGYIWRHSRRDQLAICLVVLASLPFYFASLDVPRRIINDAIMGKAFENGNATAPFLAVSVHWPGWLGGDGGALTLFDGAQLDRSSLLVGLSTLFLVLVLINGAFKFYINLTKGILGERMLRRLRFELFSLMLRFSPEAAREVKSSETATIIRDEVEPIGTFIGDAVVTPVFLGTQAATALAFILMQNIWLGLVAGAMVGVQIVVIPRLRREIIRLSRKRQLASRNFAGRVGELLEGLETITVNNAGRWERAEIGERLYRLFDLRLKIYKRKFLVKYLNNLLSQITPFLFYAIGGMFALRGQLDIGQLVAVLAAYRDLPPPLKELIDWDQQRLDVEVKYETVASHFAYRRLRPVEHEAPEENVSLVGSLSVEGLVLPDSHGGPPLEVADFDVLLPAQLALYSPGSEHAHLFARHLVGLAAQRSGRVRVGERDLESLPRSLRAQKIAYASGAPTLFPGTVRENLLYGLRGRPPVRSGGGRLDGRRLAEARMSGNPLETVDDPWIDLPALGIRDQTELDASVLVLLEQLGMGQDLYYFGLMARAGVRHDTPLGQKLIEARSRLRCHLSKGEMAELVIPFDRLQYNPQATVAENLLFGVPYNPAFVGQALAVETRFRTALTRLGLLDELAAMGVAIGRNLIEIFRDVPPNHPLFQRFSAMIPEDLPEFERRLTGIIPGRALAPAESQAFLSLALSYVEPRQRLGLLGGQEMARLVAARGPLLSALQGTQGGVVEPYDPNRVNTCSSIIDNLLFGRIDMARMHGEAYIQREVHKVVSELGIEPAIRLRGLEYQAGHRGRNLTLRQQVLTDLARAMLRQPEILIIGGGLEHLDRGANSIRNLADRILPRSSFIVVASNLAEASELDICIDLNPATRTDREL